MSNKIYKMINPSEFEFYKILIDPSNQIQKDICKNDVGYFTPYEDVHLIYVKVYNSITSETILESKDYLKFDQLVSIIKSYLSAKYTKNIFIGICDVTAYTINFSVTHKYANEMYSFYYYVKNYLKDDTSTYTPSQLMKKFEDTRMHDYDIAMNFKEIEDKTNQWIGYKYHKDEE